ncbi:hypothetical protein QL285_029352 [Trifolium repens]|nr:hypothetical protein QL285_029352 [Trifolium repens]
MKIKPFIFVFFLCALVLISIVAIESSKDGKQTHATEESNINSEDQGGRHGDGYWGGWTGKRGIVGEGENEMRGKEDEVENRGSGGDGEGGVEGGWGEGENGQSGGGGQVGVGQKGKT